MSAKDVQRELFRTPPAAWAGIFARQGAGSSVYAIAAGATVQVAQKNDRHSLRVKNIHATIDVFYGRSKADAESTTKRQTLWAKTAEVYEIHYGGLVLVQVQPPLYQQLYHCEWEDEMWINNPGAATVTIEVYEVG